MPRCPESCTCNRHKAKGVKRDPEIGRRISASKMGHSVSAETRRKIGGASRGRIQTPEQIEARVSKNRTHGRYGSSEYRAWDAMKQRCHNPRSRQYAAYGAAGIAVCDRWRGSFENFLADMGPKPDDGQKRSIDRIDSARGYEPDNCRWATVSEQNRNRPNFNPNKAKKCLPGCTCRKHTWRKNAQ